MSDFRVTADRDGSRSFGGHDDRDVVSYTGKSRRGFRGKGPRGARRPYRGRGSGPTPRSRLDADGDIDMDEGAMSGPSRRYNPYGDRGRQRNRRGDKGKNRGGAAMFAKSLPGRGGGSRQTGWFKIRIPHGAKVEKAFILKNITDLSSVPFVPVQFAHEGNSAVFFVNDSYAAKAIAKVSGRITLPNGFKMIIVSQPSDSIPMAEETVQKLKVCMSNRYDPSTKMLNLSNLYNDTDLNKDGIKFSLSKKEVSAAINQIIIENIPEVEGLDMGENRIFRLDCVKFLVSKTPNIVSFKIGKNQIEDLGELHKVKGWSLKELHLDGNPLCNKFDDQDSYISAVRKIFPKIVWLDGKELAPAITFEIESTTKLPPTQSHYFSNDQVKSVICRFLEQYFQVYDSGDRQGLLNAYHDRAIFSMCSYTKKNLNRSQPSHKPPSLSDYYQHGRNLKTLGDTGKRQKLLKTGRLSIAALLNELPATQHDPSSFKVDVNSVSGSTLIFTVQGVFKETDSKQHPLPLLSFSRVFVTMAQGTGIVVVNEQFSVTNASVEQIQNAFKSPAPTPSSSPVLPAPGAEEQQQLQLIQRFSETSGMNLEWSKKCLADNEWNFEKAGAVFIDLKGKGAIPAEAFIK